MGPAHHICTATDKLSNAVKTPRLDTNPFYFEVFKLRNYKRGLRDFIIWYESSSAYIRRCEAKQLDRKYHLDTTNYRGTNNASSVISCLTLKWSVYLILYARYLDILMMIGKHEF